MELYDIAYSTTLESNKSQVEREKSGKWLSLQRMKEKRILALSLRSSSILLALLS